MRKLKILHFSLGFIPVYGGNTTRLLSLLSDNIHDHYLYVPASPSIFIPRDMNIEPSDQDFGQIHVRRIRMHGYPKQSFPVLDYLRHFRYLKENTKLLTRAVKESDIDIVYGHSPLEFSLPSLAFAREKGLPFFYEAHSIKYDNLWRANHPVLRHYHRFMQQVLVNKEKSVFQNAKVVVAQTAMSGNRISSLYGIDEKKILVLHNGVDTEKFDPAIYASTAEQLRRKRKWLGKFVVMYTGLLDWTNGISFLLECMEKLPPAIKSAIKIVFIGRGELKERIIDMSKQVNFVEYLGLVSHDEVPVHMAASDLFCIPRPSSLPAETLTPMKLLEAMAMEKLVLVSDVGGMTEIVQDGRNGFVFKHGNISDFIKALEKVISLAEDSKAVGQKARRDVIAGYTWQNARSRLQEAYDLVAGSAIS